jgi:rubrerythrin
MNSAEIAVRMETDAIHFYQEAAGKTQNPVGRKMFLTIAGDEKKHLEMISQYLKGLDFAVSDLPPMERIKTVFEELKDTMMQRVEATTDDLEAFKIAMDMELEGKVFYEKAASAAATDKEKILFRKLVSEEEQHYAVFANTYNFMKDTGNWFMWSEHSIVEG